MAKKSKAKGNHNDIRARNFRIKRVKTLFPIGYKLCQQDPNRPATPECDPNKVDSAGFTSQLKHFTTHVTNLQNSEETEISVEEAKQLIEGFKQNEPSYLGYNKTMKSQNFRLVKTPEPQEMMRGDEWLEMSEKWKKELLECMKSQEFIDLRNSDGNTKKRRQRKGARNAAKVQNKTETAPQETPKNDSKMVEIETKSGSPESRENKPELANNQPKVEVKEAEAKTDSLVKRCRRLNDVKKKYSQELELCPDKLELPSVTDECNEKQWNHKVEQAVKNFQGFLKSNDVRFSALKKVQNLPEYKKMISNPLQIAQIQLPNLSDETSDEVWFGQLSLAEKEIKDMISRISRKIMDDNHAFNFKVKIENFKQSEAYQATVESQSQRPKTPVMTKNRNKDMMEVENWKQAIEASHKKKCKFLSSRMERDVNAMKDTLLYMKYAKGHHFGEIPRVKTPEKSVISLEHWETKFNEWKFQLKNVVETHSKRKRTESESKSVSKSSKHLKTTGIDFKHLMTLEPTEMLQYVQDKSQDYIPGLDQKFPEGRQFLGSIVGGCIRYVPCGLYNKDNSCDQSFVHDEKIHACALCYFTMGGMINVHRLIQCPLLAYDNT